MNKNVKKILIVLCAITLLCGGILLGINFENWFGGGEREDGSGGGTHARTPDIDPGAVDWIGPQSLHQSDNPGGGIAVPGFTSKRMAADQLEQKVNFFNPESNACYFVLTLMLPDGTVIFESAMIPPGSGLYEITLIQTVPGGSYVNSVLRYDTFNMDDNLTQLNGADVKLELIFE